MKTAFKSFPSFIFIGLLLVSFQNCGPGFKVADEFTSTLSESSTAYPDSNQIVSPQDPRISLNLKRIKTGTGRDVEASISREDRGWTESDELVLTANQGATFTRLTNIDSTSKTIRFLVVPPAGFNGELTLTANYLNSKTNLVDKKEKTALIIEQVHPSFGQPEAVRGLVNTRGHEDGLSVSPDGEWLMIHYLPISFDCYIKGGGSAAAPECSQVVGPVDAPERPNMPGRSRITAQNQVMQSCPRLGLINPAYSIAPSTYYIFKKNSEGEFVSPREFSFLNGDGCFFPFGPQIQMSENGTARLYISWENYYAGHNEGNDVQGMSVDMNSNFLMGILPATGQISTPDQLFLQRLNIPAAGNQGNPHVHEDSTGNPSIVFWDDENQSEENRRMKFVSKQNGSWTNAKDLPPSIFNAIAGGAIQPFFDGSRLIFRAGGQINMSVYNGGPMEQESSWSAPQTLVRANQSTQVGRLMTLGEPSITFDRYGKQVMYFVYATVRSDGKSDFNAAFVPRDE